MSIFKYNIYNTYNTKQDIIYLSYTELNNLFYENFIENNYSVNII